VARSTLDGDAYALQSAQQEVARLTAALEQARSELDKYTIRAPFAGSIVALETEPGQIVGPSVPLLTLADLGALVVEADVDETYATRIAVDQPAILQLTGETATREGRVRFVSRKVDATNGALAIKLDFDAPVTAPLGLTVAVNIIVDSCAAALTVPRSALTVGAQGTGVFLLADGLAQYRPITVVDWPATRLIVTDGLTEGEVVITQAEGIEDGQAVLIEMP
jgi:RND family efflux transporter MFP subunit